MNVIQKQELYNKLVSRFNPEIVNIVKDFRLIDDDFMTAVFEDKECTELLLKIVLERDDLTVTEVRSQYTLKNLQGRSVRLDVFAVDRDGKVYNIEIQRSDAGAISRRARYNSSLMDANVSYAGEKMEHLPETYVIFITENDVIGGNLPLYHVERRIVETGERFEDGSHILYVNSQIRDNTTLGRLMQDFYCIDSEDMNYETLAKRVSYYKDTEEGVTNMCRSVETLCDKTMRQGIEQGIERGIERGIEQGKIETAKKMLAKNKYTLDEISELSGLPLEKIEELAKEVEA